MELAIGVGAAVAVAVAVGVLAWLVRWAAMRLLHPANREDANDARAALAESERVFGLSTVTGGNLQWPWKDGATTYSENELRLRLDTAADRIGDPGLRRELVIVRDSLRTLFATARSRQPWVYYEGGPQPPPDHSSDHHRQLQIEAADTGKLAIDQARARLSKLERRAPLWRA